MYHTKLIQFLHITLASDMNDKSYPSSMESNCGSAVATAAATRTSQLKRSSAAVAATARGGGGGAAVHLCANIYVTALLAPTFDIGP